jgi:hypothetical protein
VELEIEIDCLSRSGDECLVLRRAGERQLGYESEK